MIEHVLKSEIFSLLFSSFAALSVGSDFGLATFNHKIWLYDVQGPTPVVKNVFILPDPERKLPLELEDRMPLLFFSGAVRDQVTFYV